MEFTRNDRNHIVDSSGESGGSDWDSDSESDQMQRALMNSLQANAGYEIDEGSHEYDPNEGVDEGSHEYDVNYGNDSDTDTMNADENGMMVESPTVPILKKESSLLDVLRPWDGSSSSSSEESPPSSQADWDTQEPASDFDDAIEHYGIGSGATGALRLGESVQYDVSTTKGRGKKGDKMTGDHIPSDASNQLFAKTNKDTRTKGQITNQGNTFVVSEDVHKDYSRTFGGRNNPTQIDEDSKNRERAVYKDFRQYGHAMRNDGKLKPDFVSGMANHYKKLVGDKVIKGNKQTADMLTYNMKKAVKEEKKENKKKKLQQVQNNTNKTWINNNNNNNNNNNGGGTGGTGTGMTV